MQLYATCRPFPERASVLVVAVGLVAWNRGSCRVVRIASFCGRFAAGIEGASPQEKRSGCGFSTCTSATPAGEFPQVENLRPLWKTAGHVGQPVAHAKNAAADGTLEDAARGQARASRSSCHRVFRSRGRFEPGPGFVRNQGYPDLVAVTFFLTFFLGALVRSPDPCGGREHAAPVHDFPVGW